MMEDVKMHYDKLIDLNNDPFNDSDELREYMKKWDGEIFIKSMELDESKRVLEVGIGSGRIAKDVAPCCKSLVGIDLSKKTIDVAMHNLKDFDNVSYIADDFIKHKFKINFDVVYSSLTLMHFENKEEFHNKVFSVLKEGGLYCLSIDKNQNGFIDMGDYKLKIFPDSKYSTQQDILSSNFEILKIIETEFAFLFITKKKHQL